MQSTKQIQKNSQQKSKKGQEAVSKYLYHSSKFNVDLKQQVLQQKFTLKTMNTNANKQYIYAQYLKDSIEGMPQHILHSVLYKHYSNNLSIRIRNNISLSTTFQHNLLPFSSTAEEILQFIIEELPNSQYAFENEVKKIVPDKKHQTNKKGQSKRERYRIYVIHHCHTKQSVQKQILWENFVQSFQFSNQNIKYNMICTAQQQTGFFSAFTSKFSSQNHLSQFVAMYSNQQRLNKIIGSALQLYDEALILDKIQLDKNDPVYGRQHNRLAHLPSQHYEKYQLVKQKLKKYNITDNQVCRFLQVNKYDAELTITHIQEYKNFISNIEKRSSLMNFQYFYAADIYTLLGEDYHGRPVILNKGANVRVDQFDVEQYCHFFMFWLQIFLVSKMRGNVDQFVIIADVKNISSANFKLSLTKRNVAEGLRYCPQRQLKAYAINLNTFVKFCAYNFLIPLLPENTHQKIIIAGQEKQQIIATLTKDMSIDVIPKYIGGNNILGNTNENIDEQ